MCIIDQTWLYSERAMSNSYSGGIETFPFNCLLVYFWPEVKNDAKFFVSKIGFFGFLIFFEQFSLRVRSKSTSQCEKVPSLTFSPTFSKKNCMTLLLFHKNQNFGRFEGRIWLDDDSGQSGGTMFDFFCLELSGEVSPLSSIRI